MSAQEHSNVWALPREPESLAGAGDALRTLATLQDAVAEVEALGGIVGTRPLAATIYTHLRGADPEQTRAWADRLDELAEAHG